MTAYYNDNDPFAAAWLRNLIAEGHLPPGDVDDRSILEVSADDLRSYIQVHLYSPVLEDGPLPSSSQAGPTTDPSGLVAVPVSRFRAQDSEKAMPTNVISGPLFNASSPSAALQWSLESRLRQRMEGNGSPLYALTWSHWDMPAGPSILRLRASGRRTFAKGSTGWPTVTVGGFQANRFSKEQSQRPIMANGSTDGHRPSPLAQQELAATIRKDFTPNLANGAQMTGWPTPNAGPQNDNDSTWQEIASSNQGTAQERQRIRANPWHGCEFIPCADGKVEAN